MKQRAADMTVLLAGRSRVARADFVRGELVAFARDDQPSAEGLVGLVETAASLGGDLPKRVWVLSEEIFALEIRLRAQAVDGLSREQTLRLLGYEASAISGLSTGDAWIAAMPSPATPIERAFTVVQVARADRDAVESALSAYGSRLVGIAHPAGVPRALDEQAPASWRRLEAWPDLAVEVESANGTVAARLRRTDPTRRARDLGGEKSITETLETGGGPALPAPAGARAFDLAREDDLRAWTAAWGRALFEDAARIAFVGPTERELSPRWRAGYAVGGALLAAAVCGWHYSTRTAARDAAVIELAAIRAPTERLAKTRAEAGRLKAEVEKLEDEAATMRAALARAGWSADAPARFLEAAAAGRPAGLTADALEVGWRGARVRGVALRAHLVDDLGRALSVALAPEGFVVAPADRKRRALESGVEIFDYTLEVVPQSIAPPPAEFER